MQAPAFWYQKRGLRAWGLSPLGALYGYATACRVRHAGDGYKARCLVISVGNINAGGTGKTPTCIALAERLITRGAHPVFVTRGYGGSAEGPVQVDPQTNDAAQVGDEPLLLAAFAPTIVAKDRAGGVRMAQDMGDVIILDDAHQNPSVRKDLSIVVVDAYRGFGNGLCLPAGPLRETVSAGLARADLVVSIGRPSAQKSFAATWPTVTALPHLQAALSPLPTGMPWQGLPVVAFAGIGHPDKFFQTLRDMGADLRGTTALGDHQPYTTALLQRLTAEAATKKAQLVTTEKDAVRLPASFRSVVLPLPVRLTSDDWGALDGALDLLGV